VVTLSGSAGIGKSRLLQALQQAIDDEDHVRLHYQCSPYHANSAFYPVISQIERAAGFEVGDAADTRLDKLEAVIEGDGDAVRLLAALLSLPFEARYGPLDLAPEARAQRTREALIAQLFALARRRPVLALFEDTHWLDPSTEELLREAVARILDAPMLVLITHRPEWRPPWSDAPQAMALAMGRLARPQAAEIVRAITGPMVAEATVSRIVDRTDGIPLFVEELTKALLERGLNGAEAEVPATLQASLAARLDRLSPAAKEVAQIGAVIGREFGHELLAAVAGQTESGLAAALDPLLRSDLVFRLGARPRVSYAFKHALVQDAAYQSLLNARKKELHRRIARTLAATGEAVELPEVVAQHFEKADETDRAAEFWWRAANRSLQNSANREAIEQARHCTRLLAGAQAPAARQTLIQAHSLIGAASIGIYGFSSEEVERAFEATMALARKHRELDAEFLALSLQCGTVLSRHGARAVLDVATRMLEIADLQSDRAKRSMTKTIEGIGLLLLGRLSQSRAKLQEGWDLCQQVEVASAPAMGGADFRIPLIGYRRLCDDLQGQTRDMVAWAGRAEEIARAEGSVFSLAWAKLGLVRSLIAQQRLDEARAEIEAGLKICGEKGFDQRAGQFRMLRGQTKLLSGRAAAALEDIESGREDWMRAGTNFHASEFDCLLAEALTGLDDLDAAQQVLDRAEAHEDRFEEVYNRAERLRLQGDLLLRRGRRPAAMDAYADAIDVSCAQAAYRLELQAVCALAHALQTGGEAARARRLLTKAQGRLPAGFDAPVRQEADTLLAGDV